MRSDTEASTGRVTRSRGALAALAVAVAVVAVASTQAMAASGGISPGGGTSTGGGSTGDGGSTKGGSGGTPTEVTETGPPGKARLKHGKAIPPRDAPKRVINAIEAGNKIVKGKDYCLGGGHRKWRSRCYDCSGTVSFALHAARMLRSPLPSGSLAKWGDRGKGEWITVFANGGHAYMTVAGLRLDTSQTDGKGPGWSDQMVSKRGYKVRHYANY